MSEHYRPKATSPEEEAKLAMAEEKILKGCRALSQEDKELLREIFDLKPEEDVCKEVATQLAKVKKQLKATAIIVGLLNEGLPE